MNSALPPDPPPALPAELLGAAHDLFELLASDSGFANTARRTATNAAPAVRTATARDSEHQVLDHPHRPVRAEALPHDDHHEAQRQRDQGRQADPLEVGEGARGPRGTAPLTYFSVRAITSRWISFVPS